MTTNQRHLSAELKASRSALEKLEKRSRFSWGRVLIALALIAVIAFCLL